MVKAWSVYQLTFPLSYNQAFANAIKCHFKDKLPVMLVSVK